MRFRAAALPLCLMLTLAACGARLTNAERLAGIRSLDRGNGSQVGAQAGTKSGVNVGPTFGPGGSNGAFGPDAGGTTGIGANLPPGSNGGATDIGVTGNQIT